MRVIVARCDVRYADRLSTVLPEARRFLVVKSDGWVMDHRRHCRDCARPRNL